MCILYPSVILFKGIIKPTFVERNTRLKGTREEEEEKSVAEQHKRRDCVFKLKTCWDRPRLSLPLVWYTSLLSFYSTAAMGVNQSAKRKHHIKDDEEGMLLFLKYIIKKHPLFSFHILCLLYLTFSNYHIFI